MRKIKIKQKISMSGEYSWDGNKYPNVLTDVGLTRIAEILIGHNLPPLYIEGGYGFTPPLTTDTDLAAPVPNSDIVYKDTESSTQPFEYPRKQADVFRVEEIGLPGEVATTPITENEVVIRYSSLIGGEEGDTTGFPGVFEELGVFDLPYHPIVRGGLMFSRALALPAVQTRNNLGGSLRWTLTIDKGNVSENGGITQGALEVLANVLMRRKDDGLHSSELEQTNTVRQYKAKYVDLFLNTIRVGSGDSPTSEDMNSLEERIIEGNFNASSGLGRLTSVNIIPASTSGGIEFPAIIQIQRAIRFGDVNEEIKEVGLFNINYTKTFAIGNITEHFMWGRHVLNTPLPAGEEAVIQFDIEIGR